MSEAAPAEDQELDNELIENDENQDLENEALESQELENQEPKEGEDTEEKPHQSRSQNAKQRLRRKLGESEDRNRALADTIAKQQEILDALEGKIDSVINPPAARPQREDFETEEDYEDALYDFRTQKQAETPKPKPEPAVQTQREDNVPPDVRRNWNSQLDACNDKYEDFEDVLVSIPYEAMTNAMTETLMESEQGGEIAYFLGNNPKEASRIARLTTSGQVKELVKLENKFHKSTSNAPAPITPAKGGSTTTADVESMPADEYRAMRRKQRAK